MSAMRVLIAHARYRQRGGEDVVAEAEAQLLKSRGHVVANYNHDNKDIDAAQPLSAALRTLWSKKTTAELPRVFDEFQPDVIHVHNTFPSISPSLYWVAARYGIPIVQTLHNFRLLCPQAMLLRDGSVCEDCVGRAPWRAVMHGCYRDSAHSAVLASMLMTHRSLGTYRKVTRYIALNEFCRSKFIAGGLPAEKILVKPNFADVPLPNALAPRSGGLFAGRLSKEKGIEVLLEASAMLPAQCIQIVGEGPERARLENRSNISLLGWLEPPALLAAMRRSAYLILPSIWYENSPRTLIEAFGCGLPVIASKLGALAELVDHGRTGLLFDPKSAADLARLICWAEEHPSEMRVMGQAARREFELHYSPDRTYSQLVAIYREAIDAQYSMEVA